MGRQDGQDAQRIHGERGERHSRDTSEDGQDTYLEWMLIERDKQSRHTLNANLAH